MLQSTRAPKSRGLAIGVAALAFGLAYCSPTVAQDLVPQSGAKAEELKRSLAGIKLPPGFSISLYAIVPGARALAVGPNGKVVFVGTLEKSVYAVRDRAQSGSADEVVEFAPSVKKKMPHGVCFDRNGALYVVEQNRVLSFADAEASYANPSIAAKPIVAQGDLIPTADENSNHSARVCRVGPADEKLYVALGDPYNVPPHDKMAEYDKWGIGGIIRLNLDGSNREIFASGIRNSVGMDFNPADRTLWFTDNQVDRMGDDIPPGEINRALRAGLNFGFPWYGGGHTRTEEYKSETPPADVVFPEVETVAHAADLGMTFYHGAQFPQKYRGGIFSAQHGSWNRTVPIGARVMFTSLKPDGHADKTEPFAEGWRQPDGSYSGRPVDVAELPDGSILVSDDYNGALYRIVYIPPK
ncbi:PQQ-dependent sugar dehydrogenase [Methylocapsa acidiphila]|uniref:PQQ-dependent sugar dehydrogenase n=1 Tax=Methylocapsa acidiphila TaxID=133552 RepID=UPI0003FCEE17|nr:PQQ-dependent sugar dehydrogenase [Methylocapsa acidiphila]